MLNWLWNCRRTNLFSSLSLQIVFAFPGLGHNSYKLAFYSPNVLFATEFYFSIKRWTLFGCSLDQTRCRCSRVVTNFVFRWFWWTLECAAKMKNRWTSSFCSKSDQVKMPEIPLAFEFFTTVESIKHMIYVNALQIYFCSSTKRFLKTPNGLDRAKTQISRKEEFSRSLINLRMTCAAVQIQTTTNKAQWMKHVWSN